MINKLHIKNYRSFGNEWIKLNTLKKINIFIGKNNVGKSNILKFISLIGDKPLGGDSPLELNKSLDYFNYPDNIEFVIGKESPDLNEEYKTFFDYKDIYAHFSVDHLSQKPSLIGSFIHDSPEKKVREFVEKFRHTSGGQIKDIITNAIVALNPVKEVEKNEVILIDEYRNLLTNTNLRNELDALINYTRETRIPNEEKSKELHRFISSLYEKEVKIRVPSKRESEIELEIGSKLLPISSIGTGLHQMILIGMYVSVQENKIICIDEPELHTHPALQRKFLEYISKNFNHQYFIATHSNSLLDYSLDNKSVYLIGEENEQTTSRYINNLNKAKEVLNDLGIRSSEILQTNGIIWVEGPSDRIYVKKWIELLEPSLKEGLNYSFQFYGGKILSHYSIGDDDFENFISMLLINRNSYIIIDSDMSKNYENKDLRETKRRIIKDAEKNNIKHWITEGREIENYLSSKILSTHFKRKIDRNKFTKFSSYIPSYGTKVKFSKKITSIMGSNEIKDNLDLEKNISEIIKEIQSWNLFK